MMTDDEIERGSLFGHKLMQMLISSRLTPNIALLAVAILAGEFLINQGEGNTEAAEATLYESLLPNIQVIIGKATKVEDGIQPRQ
jgi:hypothetical protein